MGHYKQTFNLIYLNILFSKTDLSFICVIYIVMPKKVEPEKIVNFYERIPKKFLNHAENPNFDLHHIKIPCRFVLNAPSGSGKTNFLINLLSAFCQGRGTFQNIWIITKCKEEPLYKWLESIDEALIIKEGLQSLPPLDKMDKRVNNLVVLDDMQNEKDLSVVEIIIYAVVSSTVVSFFSRKIIFEYQKS